jgi:hypothetical protein
MNDQIDNDFGMRCPNCKASDQIDVCANIWLRLCRDGTDPYEAANQHHEWDEHNNAVCRTCGHDGDVAEFSKAGGPDNQTRADRANEALRQYVEAKGEVFEESCSEIADLIADLLHLAARWDQGDGPIDSTLMLARMHFDAECDREGEQP